MNRVLIVNADDFGRSAGINEGIARAHEQGIVTSASLMVRFPAAAEAAAYAREHPDLSVGLHVDLGEWIPDHDGWRALYERPVSGDGRLQEEVGGQLSQFRELLGRDPTHLDSHQHVHKDEPLRTILAELGARLSVPVRSFDSRVRYVGSFYGQGVRGCPLPEAITVEALIALLATVPMGVTELGCHPGIRSDLDSTYLSERAQEVEVLCDPRVRSALKSEGIELRSFADALV